MLSGILFLAGLAFLFAVDSQTIYSISSFLSVPHTDSCMLCGMTESCISISRGDISNAYHTNELSVHLFSLLSLNLIILLTFLFVKLKKGKT